MKWKRALYNNFLNFLEKNSSHFPKVYDFLTILMTQNNEKDFVTLFVDFFSKNEETIKEEMLSLREKIIKEKNLYMTLPDLIHKKVYTNNTLCRQSIFGDSSKATSNIVTTTHPKIISVYS